MDQSMEQLNRGAPCGSVMRVSTQDQNLDLQINALIKAGCNRLFDDKMSVSRAERPGLAKALDMLCEGDTLVV